MNPPGILVCGFGTNTCLQCDYRGFTKLENKEEKGHTLKFEDGMMIPWIFFFFFLVILFNFQTMLQKINFLKFLWIFF
jgi:hypothetical protein